MSIQIKQNKKPELPVCEMLCDTILHKKLDKYPLTQSLFQKHSTTAIIGKPGQGKSSLLWSWFKSNRVFKKTFHKIFYICPASSMASMSDNIFEQLPEHQIYHELTGEILDEIIDFARASEKKDKICIIIDDMGAYLKRHDVYVKLRQIAMNKRHMHIFETIILMQTWKSAPLEVRRLFDNIILFKLGKNDMENVLKEVLESKQQYADDLVKMVFDKKHNYLAIRVESGKMFKNWDTIVFPDDDDDDFLDK